MQTRFRSPYTLSIRPTVGQNFVEELTQGAGNAVEYRELQVNRKSEEENADSEESKMRVLLVVLREHKT